MFMIFECGEEVYIVYEHNKNFRIYDNMLTGCVYKASYARDRENKLKFVSCTIIPTKIDKIHSFFKQDDYHAKVLELVSPKATVYNYKTMPNNTKGIVVNNMFHTGKTVIKIDDQVVVLMEDSTDYVTNSTWEIQLTHNIDFQSL